MPPVIDLYDIFDKEIIEAKEIIHEVLRKGHIMSITGPSKAGKSWALINLGLCIASGRQWDLGKHHCEKSKVLYLDMELSPSSFKKRVLTVANKLELIKSQIKDTFIPIAFRGYQRVNILNDIKTYLDKHKPDVLMLDPIYKVLQGKEENSNTEMADFANQLDRLAVKYDCSIIYVHHHSKGSQEGKRGLDKGSGAGIWGRHPDSILSLTQKRDKKGNYVPNTYVLEYDLREFKSPESSLVKFDYPIHKPTNDNDQEEIDNKEIIEKLKIGHITWDSTAEKYGFLENQQIEICRELSSQGFALDPKTDTFKEVKND